MVFVTFCLNCHVPPGWRWRNGFLAAFYLNRRLGAEMLARCDGQGLSPGQAHRLGALGTRAPPPPSPRGYVCFSRGALPGRKSAATIVTHPPWRCAMQAQDIGPPADVSGDVLAQAAPRANLPPAFPERSDQSSCQRPRILILSVRLLTVKRVWHKILLNR